MICVITLVKMLWTEQILTTVMTSIVVDESTDHVKPHFDLFFLLKYQRQRKCFLRAWAEKGIVWHVDANSVVWTLIDNGKLVNHIVILVAIVEKNVFITSSHSLEWLKTVIFLWDAWALVCTSAQGITWSAEGSWDSVWDSSLQKSKQTRRHKSYFIKLCSHPV